MPDETFRFASDTDGLSIQAYAWHTARPRAAVVISHGAAEHARRYERFAQALLDAGMDAWAADQRGHGETAGVERLGDFGPGGWDALVADIGQLIAIVRERNPGVPVALLGHSMGSMAAQQFAPEGSGSIEALILSGSTAREAPKAGAPPPGAWEPNKAFEPARTLYDWLSRDPAEVDKYVADPYCGFETVRVRGGQRADPARLSDPERLRRIRPDLPTLLMAGDQDPVNRGLAGLSLLESWWRDAGVRRIDTLYYPGGRHEMLNEINHEDVTRDIIDWLRDALGIETGNER